MKRFLILTLVLVAVLPAYGQRDSSAEVVTTEAVDGLTLVAEFYPMEDTAPSVMLLHMLSSRRTAWSPLIPSLTDAGYNVLAIDLRGHGDTGGARDWSLAERDVESWIDWLMAQPSSSQEPVALVGGSVGANLALVGCAADTRCATVIALSPGLDFAGITPEFAIEGLADRPILLVASQGDSASSEAVKLFTGIAQGELGVQLYSGSLHGTTLLTEPEPLVIDLVTDWLAEYLMLG